MQNRTLARHQAYELPKNYTPVNFIVGSDEDEGSGKRYGRKFTSKDLAEVSPLPLALPLDAVAGPLSRIA